VRSPIQTAKRLGLLVCLVLGALAALVSAAQAAPAPGWALALTPMPSNFAPGATSEYFATATNVGGGPSSGKIELEVTLPSGVVPVEVKGRKNDPAAASAPTCTIVSQTIECETSEVVHPGYWVGTQITVEVPPGTPEETLEAKASVLGGGAAQQASAVAPTQIAAERVPFDVLPDFMAPLTAEDGSAATVAGSHPQQYTVAFSFTTEVESANGLTGAGHPRYISSELPRGLLGDPAATPVLCTEAQLTAIPAGECPDASQIGLFDLTTLFGQKGLTDVLTSPVYNMVAPAGSPAEVGFNAAGIGFFIHLVTGVRTDGDYGIEVAGKDVLAVTAAPFFHLQVQTWGDPSSESHDAIRGECGRIANGSCPVGRQDTAFLTMPSDCSGQPLIHGLSSSSWEAPTLFKERQYESADLEGNPVAVDGCNQLDFEPTIEAQPTTNLAESPSGLNAHLHQPQNLDLEGRSTAAAKEVKVTLPEGMTLNPSAADGLSSCSSSQIGLLTAVGQSPVHFDKSLPSCPDASRLGSAEVSSPVLVRRDAEHKLELDPETGKPIPDPLTGSVYLAKPFDNPFDSLLAIYVTVEDKAKTGIVAKLPGKISADPNTGQLVTTFSEGPELPLEDVRLHFFGGARSPLITPPLCGNHTISALLTPWSAPEGKDVTATDSFATGAFPGGGNCPTSAGVAPNAPSFAAGTLAPQAGAYSPFVLKLGREDGSQRFSDVDATLPPGLIGKLAGLTQCSEAQIAAAKAREAPNMGAVELAHPSCPASSLLGPVDVSAGAGPTPLHVQAKAYLTGPYKGAPIGLAVITPAVAGPFDLGTVVVRVALDINAATAQVHAVSDPFPKVLEGIPLDVRGAALKLDRPNFTLNPTSCDPMAITGNVATLAGGLAALRTPFQVGGCSALGFKPKLELSLKGGGTKRGGHPAFNATYRPRTGDANAKDLVVRLPRSAFLDQAHIRTICTRVQFAARSCPAGAQYGFVKAWTPLLDNPLEGPVWLRSSSHKLPDLVFDLHGQIDVEVATRIDSVNGGIRARIESAPDAPLTKVLLHMQGAKKGLIVNSRDICQGSNKAEVELDAQNGKFYDLRPQLKAKCGKQGRRGHGGRGHQNHK
jgi:hypothetical protein